MALHATGTVLPQEGGEILVATIAGTFDNLDGYAIGGGSGQYEFRLYAHVGATRVRVSSAQFSGSSNGALLRWGSPPGEEPFHAGGTSYDLYVFCATGPASSITATLAGADDTDSGRASASGTVTLPKTSAEVTAVINAGYAFFADVGIIPAELPTCEFTIYASCGAGSVEGVVRQQTVQGQSLSSVMQQVQLPVATQYRLGISKAAGDGQSGPTLTASLATYSSAFGGSGPGTTTQLVVSGAPIAAGQGFIAQGTFAVLATLANVATQIVLGGVALQSGNPGDLIDVLYQGALDPAIVNVGAGLAMALALDAGGNIVRVTNPAVTSVGNLHKYIGTCDVNGNVLVGPVTKDNFNAIDYGLDNTGTVFNDAAHAAFIASIARTNQVETAYYPSGIYKFNGTIGPWPFGTLITGDGMGTQFAAKGTELQAFGPGIFIELGHSAVGNNNNPTIFEKFNVTGQLNTGHAAAPNINKIGIDVLGDVGVTIRDIDIGGFQYQISLDGCEICHVERPRFNYSGTGYTDMLTNLGDQSAAAIRIGSFAFTVGDSANDNTIDKVYFNNSFFGVFFSDGASNSLIQFGAEIPCWAMIQSGLQITIAQGLGESSTPFANIWVHSLAGPGFPGAIEGLAVRDCVFIPTVPAILIDPVSPSNIFGLDFPNNNCSQMTPGVFPITNAEPHVTAVSCPPSTLLPAAGAALGALTDGQVDAFTGVLGTIVNDTLKAQAAIDVVLIDYATPLLRLRAGPNFGSLIYYDIDPPPSKFGASFITKQQLYISQGVQPSNQLTRSLGGVNNLGAGAPAVDVANVVPPDDGTILITMNVVAKHAMVGDTTHPAFWRVHQLAYVSGGILTFPVAAVIEFADASSDANYVAPSIGGAGGVTATAHINSNSASACSFSATLDVLFIG